MGEYGFFLAGSLPRKLVLFHSASYGAGASNFFLDIQFDRPPPTLLRWR